MQYPTLVEVSDTFTIEPERSITINTPSASTTWTAGTTQTITWDSDNAGTPFRVEYSTNGGASWTIFSSSTGNDGTEHWPIPSGIDSDQCKIRLTSMQHPTLVEVSDTFTIEPERSITINTPSASTTWTAGTTQTITWDSDNAGTPFRVEYSTNGGASWTIFSSSTGNDGTEHWPIPSGIDSDQCKIRLTSMQHPTLVEVSDTFTIEPTP